MTKRLLAMMLVLSMLIFTVPALGEEIPDAAVEEAEVSETEIADKAGEAVAEPEEAVEAEAAETATVDDLWPDDGETAVIAAEDCAHSETEVQYADQIISCTSIDARWHKTVTRRFGERVVCKLCNKVISSKLYDEAETIETEEKHNYSTTMKWEDGCTCQDCGYVCHHASAEHSSEASYSADFNKDDYTDTCHYRTKVGTQTTDYCPDCLLGTTELVDCTAEKVEVPHTLEYDTTKSIFYCEDCNYTSGSHCTHLNMQVSSVPVFSGEYDGTYHWGKILGYNKTYTCPDCKCVGTAFEEADVDVAKSEHEFDDATGICEVCGVRDVNYTPIINAPTSVAVRKDETKSLDVTLKHGDGATVTYAVTAGEKYISVDSEGNVTGLQTGNGYVTVTAVNGTKSVSHVIFVNVTEAVPTKMAIGQRETVVFGSQDISTITSSNASKVTVSTANGGTIYGKKTGTATVTIAFTDGTTRNILVTVGKKCSKLAVSKSSATMLVGDAFTLTGKVTKGVSYNTSFESTNVLVATVDEYGNVAAVAPGTAKIKFKAYNGKYAYCTVTVYCKATAVNLNYYTGTLKKGKTLKLKATLAPTGSQPGVTWTTSDKSIATVDKNGKVKAVGNGIAVITATAASGVSNICSVDCYVPATKVKLSKSTVNMVSGSSYNEMTYSLSPSSACKTVTWSSSNTAIATVDENGRITAVAPGKCYIYCTARSGKRAKCKVIVTY